LRQDEQSFDDGLRVIAAVHFVLHKDTAALVEEFPACGFALFNSVPPSYLQAIVHQPVVSEDIVTQLPARIFESVFVRFFIGLL
jgi:hypothetical protein